MAPTTMPQVLDLPSARVGSGTSWIPDSSRQRFVSATVGQWMLMLQGSMFGLYVDQSTQRGDRQFAVSDWEMAMAMRSLGRGTVQLRAMTSIEPFVLGGSGTPSLLQTGGTYRHAVIHDRQHPHNALMELAAEYQRPINGAVAFSLYAGAAGEPALGPVAAMHRPSAAYDPLAPLGHHWQDASHQSFGVLTAGVFTRRVKLEASLFNPREPDENHLIVDYRDAKLDSYSARLSWAATSHVVGSTWWGFLSTHDRLDPTSRMHRYGASLLTDARGVGGGRWSSTFVWAMNLHHHGAGSHHLLHGAPGASPHHHASSMLAETTFELGTRSAVFSRLESVRKNGEELGFLGGDLMTLYTVRSAVLGASRDVVTLGGARVALGARAAWNWVPQSLLATYGTRTPRGFTVQMQVRPRPAH